MHPMLFWAEIEPLDFGQNNMGCQWQLGVCTLMEPHYPLGLLLGPFANILDT